jgi:hypothetical protein
MRSGATPAFVLARVCAPAAQACLPVSDSSSDCRARRTRIVPSAHRTHNRALVPLSHWDGPEIWTLASALVGGGAALRRWWAWRLRVGDSSRVLRPATVTSERPRTLALGAACSPASARIWSERPIAHGSG